MGPWPCPLMVRQRRPLYVTGFNTLRHTAARGTMGGLSERRKSIRAEMIAHLRSRSASPISPDVVGQLWVLLQNAPAVLVYCDCQGEFPTGTIRAFLQARNIPTYVPRIAGPGLLDWVSCLEENLRPGRFGIPEPNGPAVAALPADLWVLAPMVAFGPHGERLGYGGGYFDRFFDAYRRDHGTWPRRIGLAWSDQGPISFPVAEHDVPMEGVMTEVGWAVAPPPK